jgi:hypothetical protein
MRFAAAVYPSPAVREYGIGQQKHLPGRKMELEDPGLLYFLLQDTRLSGRKQIKVSST